MKLPMTKHVVCAKTSADNMFFDSNHPLKRVEKRSAMNDTSMPEEVFQCAGVDMHGHFREMWQHRLLAPWTAAYYGVGQAMPNSNRPIETGAQAQVYALNIESAAIAAGFSGFQVIRTIKLTARTTREIIRDAVTRYGVKSAKIYFITEGGPEITTNAHDGLNIDKFLHGDYDYLFEEMQNLGMILQVHCEFSSVKGKKIFLRDRESRAVDSVLEGIARRFLGLRIVIEHMSLGSTGRAVLGASSNVYGSLTVQHITSSIEQLMGGAGLEAENFCRPHLREPEDEIELAAIAMSGNPRIMNGNDSAFHAAFPPIADIVKVFEAPAIAAVQRAKYSPCGCAGLFNIPVAMPKIVDLFARHGTLENLDMFVRLSATMLFDLEYPKRVIRYIRKPWKVPNFFRAAGPDGENDLAVSYLHGQTLQYQPAERWFRPDMIDPPLQ